MKVTIPEISWHNRDPVLALDIQPCPPDGIHRLATAGTDTHVVIWQLRILDNGGVSVEALSDLTRHNRAVNAVRFSPSGELLATADDEAAIILWKKQDSGEADIFDESEKENKENWVIHKMLRGHLEDIYDISWSKCSQFLISGSVDNTAILWDVNKGKQISILNEHKGFVQGVAWDPVNNYVATLCSDRCCRVYSITTKKVISKIEKMMLPKTDTEDGVSEKISKLFYDDTLKSFCRRLTFSPDGQILLAPSGIVEEEDGKTTNVTHMFSRYNFSKPVLYLPTKDKYTLAVRFSPVLYELKPLAKEGQEEDGNIEKDDKESPSEDWKKYYNQLDLPYRMIFAVATQNAIILYDTQQPVPFAKISNIHYTRLSDIAWSSDGRILVVSSTDGYCSLVSFSEDELGTPYKDTQVPSASPLIQGEEKQTAAKGDMKVEDVEMTTIAKPSNAKSDEVDQPVKKTTPQPIAVRRKGDSNKGGKRVSLTTLTGPGSKNNETSDKNSKEDDSHPQAKSRDVVSTKSEKVSSPVKKVVPASPVRTPTRSSKSRNENKDSDKVAPTSPVKTPTRSSKSRHEKKDSDKDGDLKMLDISEVENQSPIKKEKDQSPNKTARTPRRIHLITVSSPKGKSSPSKSNPPTQKTARRLPLTTVSGAKASEEEMELGEDVTKRFESPAKSVKSVSPSKSPSSKTPRRVALVTLSSPKGKKKLDSDSR